MGGPIFDSEGRIWAIQVNNQCYPAKVPNQQVFGRQFHICGNGTHVESIIDFLNQHNIKFNLSRD